MLSLNLLGYSHEVIGSGSLRWRAITPPEWISADDAALVSMAAGEKVIPFKKEYIAADGKRVPVIIAIATPDEPVDDSLVFIFDLTDRKKAESQLKSSESQFRLIAEVIPQIVWITDDRGKTYYCNQRFYETTGLSREQEDGFLWRQPLHADDRERFLRSAQDSQKAKAPFELKVRYRLHTGEYHWFLISSDAYA